MISLLFSCAGPLADQESLELVAMLDNGTVLETRYTQGNTGLVRGQGSFVFNHWLPGQTPLSHGYKATPSETQITGSEARIGFNTLSVAERSLRVQAEEFQARAVLSEGRKPEGLSMEDPESGLMTRLVWAGAQLSGWCSMERRSTPLLGQATILHRKQRLTESGQRDLLLVQSGSFELGMDCNDGFCLAWGWRDGEAIVTSRASISLSSDAVQLRMGEIRMDFTPSRELGAEDPYPHLMGFERMLARPWTRLSGRRIFTGVGMVDDGASTRRASVLLVHRGSGPVKTERAGKGPAREDKR